MTNPTNAPNHNHSNKPKKLPLSKLFTMRAEAWIVAWGVGLLTLIATVGLLSVSGWFITAAGIAGIVTAAGALSFDFFRPAAIIRTFAIVRTAGRYGERLASHHAVLGLLKDLRLHYFNTLAKQKLSTVQALSTSSGAMQRLTSDIDQLDELPLRFWAPWLWALLLVSITLLVTAIASVELAWTIALPLLFASVVIPAAGVYFGVSLGKAKTELKQARRSDLLNPLTAMTSLLLWGRWQEFKARFMVTDANYNQLERRAERTKLLLMATQQTMLALVILIMLWQGGERLANNDLSVPMLAALTLAIFGLYEILLPLSAAFMSFGLSLAARDRLSELDYCDDKHVVAHSRQQTQAQPILQINDANSHDHGSSPIFLAVKNLSAKLPNALKGIDNISFEILAGDTLIITGRSGAGKSTLLSVLADELEPSAGSIVVGGTLKDTALHTSYEKVGYLSQSVDIFDMTLAQNLRLGDAKATDDTLWQVLEKVALADWARQQPQGLATPLGEYGAAVSGGQARRVALARLLLKPKAMLLLDEPFAGLDAKSSAHVLTALQTQQKNGLLIIVSHQADMKGDVKRLVVS